MYLITEKATKSGLGNKDKVRYQEKSSQNHSTKVKLRGYPDTGHTSTEHPCCPANDAAVSVTLALPQNQFFMVSALCFEPHI